MRHTFITRYLDADPNPVPAGTSILDVLNGTGGDPTPPANDDPPAPVEGVNEDGSLQEGYEKDTEGNVVKSQPAAPLPDPTDDEPEDPNAFWNSVYSHTGRELKVEFGDVDPLSPEGVAMFEKVVRDNAVNEFEDHLKRTDPRAYAYMLHREAGGTDEDFFSEPSLSLPTIEAIKESVDLQSTFVKNALLNKGVPEDVATATVENYIKNNVLETKALEVFNAEKAALDKQLQNIEAAQKAALLKEQKAQQALITSLEGNINLAGIVIPDAKKNEFSSYIKQYIQQDGDNFYVVQPLTADSMSGLIKQLFLGFSGGDLSKLIEQKGMSVATQRLKAKVKAANSSAANNGSNDDSNKGKNIPLNQLIN